LEYSRQFLDDQAYCVIEFAVVDFIGFTLNRQYGMGGGGEDSERPKKTLMKAGHKMIVKLITLL
jgi:hypothetical protein